MSLDSRGTLKADIGKGRRANLRIERRKMARCQYQNGCLCIRGKRRKMWVARWREDVILADGSASRVMRSVVLGPVSEIAGRREARRLLDARLNPINQGQYRPEATMLFSKFAADCFEPGLLPTLKFATQKIYSFLLRKHLTPRFGDHRLCDISRAEIQQYLLEKLKQGFAWETTNWHAVACPRNTLKVAQAQLGHSHMATTLEVYTHASVIAQHPTTNGRRQTQKREGNPFFVS